MAGLADDRGLALEGLIADQRVVFDVPENVAYFNTASLAPQLRAVRMAGEAALERRGRPWTISASDWFADVERLRTLFASIIGCNSEGVAIVPASSYGLAVAARNLPLGAGDRVLVLADEYPSGIYTWRAAARRSGAEIVTGSEWTAGPTADSTSTSVSCAPSPVVTGSESTCTALVTDTASSGASTPTGTVSFTSAPTTGSFGSSGSCTLAATGTAGAASCSVTFTPSAGGSYTITGSYNGDGGHQTSQGTGPLSATTATPSGQPGPPSLSGAPTLKGATKAGRTLTCSTGTWTGNPTGYTYAWHRNGTLLAGFTGPTYKLGTLDEGTTLTCVVTATNAAGQASATSNTVRIPIPTVPHCPGATGSMTGTTIGHITLGMTRSRARYLYRQHSNRGKQFEDFFCLTPIGVRVGYASPILLDSVAKHAQFAVRGRVVWASTSNPYYALDGVRAGESIVTAARVLGTEPPFHIGPNYWYLARKGSYTAVLKVRGTVVQELGIANNALTKTRKAQNVLMHSFY